VLIRLLPPPRLRSPPLHRRMHIACTRFRSRAASPGREVRGPERKGAAHVKALEKCMHTLAEAARRSHSTFTGSTPASPAWKTRGRKTHFDTCSSTHWKSIPNRADKALM